MAEPPNKKKPSGRAKKVMFYKSGDTNFAGLRMAITRRNYRSFDALLDDLNDKVWLPSGVRNIHTPGGKHGVVSVDDLEDGKSYMVSSTKKPKRLDLGKVKKPPSWRNVKPISAGEARRKTQKDHSLTDPTAHPERARSYPLPTLKTPKRVVFMKNGDPRTKHMVLLNRRTAQDFDDILYDISLALKMRVKKLYSPQGHKVRRWCTQSDSVVPCRVATLL